MHSCQIYQINQHLLADINMKHKIFLLMLIADLFDIHHLIVEDIMNIEQLPKFERFDDHMFFTTKMLSFNEDEDLIVKEHLSILIVENLVITFQEGLPGDAFDDLRNRKTKFGAFAA